MSRLAAAWKRHSALLAILTGAFSLVLTNSAFNVLLPSLIRLYGISASLGGWIISSYALAMTLTMPLTALVVDRLGRKRTYVLGLGLYGLFSALGAAFSSEIAVVLLMRVAHGIAAGLMIPLSLVLLFDHYGEGSRGRIVGVWGMLLTIAPAIGPTLGGAVMQFGLLPLLLWINVPFALLSLWLCRSRLRPYAPARRKAVRVSGVLLLAAGIAALCLGIQLFSAAASAAASASASASAAAPAATSGTAFLLLLLGAVLLAAFVRRENRAREPLIRYGLVRRHAVFAAALAVSATQDVVMLGVVFVLPLLFQEALGLTPSVAGAMFVPAAVCTSLFGWVAGRWVDAGRPLGYIAWGIALMAASVAGFAFVGPGVPVIAILLLMALRGIGNGLSDMTMTTIGLNSLPAEDMHEGSALSNTLQRLVSSFAVLLLAVYYDARSQALALAGGRLADARRAALQEECVALAVLLAASLPLVFYIGKKISKECSKEFSKERGDTVARDDTATTA